MSITLEQIKEQLANCTGTTQYFKTMFFGNRVYTEGVKALADLAGAYWLIDVILSHQIKPRVRKEPFQVWTIKSKNNKASVQCRADSDSPIISRQSIPFTDFPEGEFKFYYCDNVLMIPSEY